MSDSVIDPSKVFYLIEIALAARTLYGFCRTYFVHKLLSNPAVPRSIPSKKKPVRVYMDGCFDVMHFGHANALRQARALGDVLVVGLCSEAEIRKHKGPPVMSDDERRVAVSSVKWVDEVLDDAPYVVTPEFLRELIEHHDIDIIVHGDDPCIGVDGQDVYKAVKEMGRFRTVKRTEGVSSTDIVGRMLLCTRDHHVDVSSAPLKDPRPLSRQSSFLPTSRRLVQFAGAPRAPRPGDRVIYVDGTFDMFHSGHIETLRRARELGDFLLVGVHDDATVNQRKGSNLPILNVHERTLAVLSCRYVDEVIIGAPAHVTEDMITTMNISYVVHGSYHAPRGCRVGTDERTMDPYEVPRARGIVREVPSVTDLSLEHIIHRIVSHRDDYTKRHRKKKAAEEEYFSKHKQYIQEG